MQDNRFVCVKVCILNKVCWSSYVLLIWFFLDYRVLVCHLMKIENPIGNLILLILSHCFSNYIHMYILDHIVNAILSFLLYNLKLYNQLCPNIYPSFFPISLMRLWQLEVTWTYTLQFALGGCFVIKILQQPSFIYYILSNKQAFIELYQETM